MSYIIVFIVLNIEVEFSFNNSIKKIKEDNYESDILEKLHREARYALNSHSLNLTYQTYGKAEMAYKLKAITWDEFSELNTILVRNGINNPAAQLS